MRTPRLMIFEPEILKVILIKNFRCFRDNEFTQMINEKHDPLFARNPFFSRGDLWKERRNEIAPAFSSIRTKALYLLIENVCERMTKFISEDTSEPFEVFDLSAKFTTESVSSCVFGVEANCFARGDNELRTMSKGLFQPSTTFLIKFMLASVFPVLKNFLKLQFVSDKVNNFFMNLIGETIDYRKTNKIEREDFMDFLIALQKKKGLSSADLVGHSITFFSDGLETSSILIAHAIYEVKSNKHSSHD